MSAPTPVTPKPVVAAAAPPVVVAAPAVQSQQDQIDAARRKKRLVIATIIFGVGTALFLAWFFGPKGSDPANSTSPEAQQGKGQMQYMPTFDKGGNTTNPVKREPTASPAEMLALAKKIKASGLMVYGVTQCGWTKRQREMFGDRNSEARKLFESSYIECRTREMCPNVRGYPTWIHGDQQYPGFKDADKIKQLVNEVGTLPSQAMLKMPSEPVEENLPNSIHAVPSEPSPQQIKANEVPTIEIEEIGEEEEVETSGATQKPIKENARGVSDYPPLNVPAMPGTAPMALAAAGPGHATDQMIQGNTPRESVSNPDPVKELANQMAASYSQVANDQARDPNSSLLNRARLPQSATISTGNAFEDKRLPVRKDK
jgi:hypothetical protein